MKYRHPIACLITWVELCMCLSTQGVIAATYYVDAARPNDSGAASNWGTAKQTIQAAIDIAINADDLVLVTNGVYSMGGRTNWPNGSALTNRVTVTNGVTLMAVSTNPANTTITGVADPVSGDLGSGAVRGVYMGPSSRLIGFTVRNGATLSNALSSGRGGGIYAETNSVISNCVVTLNIAAFGGGIYTSGNVYNSRIVSNEAHYGAFTPSVGGGGGIAAGSDGIIGNCIIEYNRTDTGAAASGTTTGGGSGANGGNYFNCVFYMNSPLASSGFYGGGAGYAGKYYNCQMISNTARYGGGLYNPELAQNCLIAYNTGTTLSGGGYRGTYAGCRIIGNYGTQIAGGVAGNLQSPTPYTFLYNCLVFSNFCYTAGGGVRAAGGIAGVIAMNCTIVKNAGGNISSGGVGSTSQNDSCLTNCVVSGNLGNWTAERNFTLGQTIYIDYSCYKTGVTDTAILIGAGYITNDPQFVDSTNEDFHLFRTSPCIDRGINQDWMTNSLDLGGQVRRIINRTVDMGAYEFLPKGTFFSTRGRSAE